MVDGEHGRQRDTMREMEADVLQQSGCFPKAALLLVNKQKYWSAKYNVSLRRMSAPERRWTPESRGGNFVSL